MLKGLSVDLTLTDYGIPGLFNEPDNFIQDYTDLMNSAITQVQKHKLINFNIRNNNGDHPLHLAIENKNTS